MNTDYIFLKRIAQDIELYLNTRNGLNFEEIKTFDDRFTEMKTAFPDLVGEMESGSHVDAPNNKNYLIANRMIKWLCENMELPYEEYLKIKPTL